MPKPKSSMDCYMDAIIDRDQNVLSYSKVLEKYSITPSQFYKAVGNLERLIPQAAGETRKLLEELSSDSNRKTELFRMEESFIQRQYDRMFRRIQGESQEQLYQGTLIHPENRIILVYHAINYNNPELKSMVEIQDRLGVVHEITNLPEHRRVYFQGIGLGGLMNGTMEIGKKNSSIGVLELYDAGYQKKTRDYSLFDLSQSGHLHKWNINTSVLDGYWNDPANVEEAVYHTLTENYPQLSSNNRKKVIETIKSFPDNLSDHFFALELRGLVNCAMHYHPIEVLKVFDRVYQRNTRDASLFDQSNRYHIRLNKRNRMIR